MSLSPDRRRLPGSSLLGSILRTLLGAAVLALAAATLAPFLGNAFPLLGLFQHFAVQLGVACLLCLIGLLLLRMRLWALLALALTVWHGLAVLPFLPLPPWMQTRPPPPTAAGGPPLKVLSLNLWYMSEARAETVNYLLGSGADVIATVETTDEWRQDLKALEGAYPYHLDCIAAVFRCGVALFSKIPIEQSFAGRIGGALPAVVWARLDWQGAPLTIAGLQLTNPLIGLQEGFQARQASRAADYFGKLPGDLVVMGDFNSAPWSRLQQGFRAATGLDNRGRLSFTWPSWASIVFRLPIDQIFTRGGIAARNVQPGPAVGSDHLPILGEIYRVAP